jgi:predicted dehydrogenase
MTRIAIVGAGTMARVRARALLSTGRVEICGVAARRLASAQALAAEIGCGYATDDYRQMAEARPDAVLVEVPHAAQDAIVLWALEQRLHALVGGVLATTVAAAERIRGLAERHGLTVEAGFEARYSACWLAARELLNAGALGRPVAARSFALWGGDPATWYYQQAASGGMPLTHMTYCFVNPLRWLLGEPRHVSAFANRMLHAQPGLVEQETCVASLAFESGALASLTAGFVKPGDLPSWSVTLIGTKAAVEVCPAESGAGGRVIIYRGAQVEERDYAGAPNAFDVQARAFVQALDGGGTCWNPPSATIGDIRVAEAIVAAATTRRVIDLGGTAG